MLILRSLESSYALISGMPDNLESSLNPRWQVNLRPITQIQATLSYLWPCDHITTS